MKIYKTIKIVKQPKKSNGEDCNRFSVGQTCQLPEIMADELIKNGFAELYEVKVIQKTEVINKTKNKSNGIN